MRIAGMLTRGLMLAALVGLTACAGGRDSRVAQRIMTLHPEAGPTPAHFVLCAGHGCRDRHDVHLGDGQWASVRAIFAEKAANAEEERQQVRLAIARLETLAGAATGTDADLGGTYSNMFLSDQLDCADETVNTTTYLKMLAADGLMTRHKVGGRLHKGDIITSLPHMTATIIDRETGTQWAVDSWFLDNGEPPEMATASVWHTSYEEWGSTGEPARP
jgi:hypothetical protein